MAGSNPHITILMLDVNGLNLPIKRHRLANWVKSQKPICVLYSGDPSHMQRHTQTKNKGMEEDLPSKGREKKAGVVILVFDKIDSKPTNIRRDKEGHYIMVKGSIQQEELTILNIYIPNTGVPKFVKQVLNDLQRNLDSHTIIVEDVNSQLSI